MYVDDLYTGEKYLDDFGNAAIIQQIYIKPYKDACKKDIAYRVIVSSIEENFIYHVSVFETKKEALNDLKKLSCGTFK